MQALCTKFDPEVFTNSGGSAADRQLQAKVKKICDNCNVEAQCLQYALENNENEGTWGGMTAAERRALKRGISKRSSARSRNIGATVLRQQG